MCILIFNTKCVPEIYYKITKKTAIWPVFNVVHRSVSKVTFTFNSPVLFFTGQREAAIVSPIAGTTRDIVESAIDFGGYPLLLSDTAGLRETEDAIEKEGVSRALQRARQSDLIVVVVDACTFMGKFLDSSISEDDVISNQLASYGIEIQPDQATHLVFNKSDLISDDTSQMMKKCFPES